MTNVSSELFTLTCKKCGSNNTKIALLEDVYPNDNDYSIKCSVECLDCKATEEISE